MSPPKSLHEGTEFMKLAEATSEILRLRTELATEREKFTMHTARVGAWLSMVAQELGIAQEGETVDVGKVCNAVVDRVRGISTSKS